MSAARHGFQAARADWQAGPATPEIATLQQLYLQRWQLYTGQYFTDPARNIPHRNNPRVYRNTRLLWKHYETVVNFYAATVYKGDLSTDGKPLPDGTRGAIPIDPQTENDETDAQLIRSIAELWSAWNWRQQMTLRPMYGAALGDCLTELVDELERGFVYPQIIWPGHVVEIELDRVGNIIRYVLQYHVRETGDKGDKTDTYTYRKEVDKDAFRYFKDDRPHDYYGEGAVVPNPYGFVPAVWDRHRFSHPDDVRGMTATESTQQAVFELNSIFSHAFDYQRKAFFTPIIVTGKIAGKQGPQVNLSAPPRSGDAGSLATDVPFLEAESDASIQQPQFDVGKTLEMLEFVKNGIVDENPEARFYSELRSMAHVSAPGAERLMGDVKNRVKQAQAGYDIGSVKLFQMALSMCGMRANDGSWGRSSELTRRQRQFLPYILDTYHRGEMDFGISERNMLDPTEAERIELIRMREELQTAWGLEQLGLSPDDAQRILREKRDAALLDMGLADLPETERPDLGERDEEVA